MLLHVLLALVYRVLMRTRERGENKLAGIRVTRLDAHMRRTLVDVLYRIYIVQIKLGVNALRVEIEREGYEIYVSRPFAVSEERALYSFRAREHSELRRSNCRSAVIVWMQADYRVLAVGETAAEILYLIGKKIRRAALDGRGQIEYHLVALARVKRVHDGSADFRGKVRLRAHEALW